MEYRKKAGLPFSYILLPNLLISGFSGDLSGDLSGLSGDSAGDMERVLEGGLRED